MLHPQLYPNRECRIEISNEEPDHLAGASRQSVNRALHALEKSGLIKIAIEIHGARYPGPARAQEWASDASLGQRTSLGQWDMSQPKAEQSEGVAA
jgi:hypothetical protein